MNELLERLTGHLTKQGVKDPEKIAKEVLIKQGSMLENGELTTQGKYRVKLGVSGRAKARAAGYKKRK